MKHRGKGRCTENTELSISEFSEGGISITWSSSAPAIISNTGVVVRPAGGTEPQLVTLTANVAKSGVTVVKEYQLTVMPSLSNADAVKFDADNLALSGSFDNLRSGLTLPTSGFEGSTISWTSSIPNLLSNSGKLIYLPEKGTGKTKVRLTATISKGNANRAFILMKSDNLPDWKTSVVNIPKTFPAFTGAQRVGAPQTIYDSGTASSQKIFVN